MSEPLEPSTITRVPSEEASKRIKRFVQGCFGLLVIPRLAAYFIAKTLIGERAITSSAESIARVPGLRGVYLRQAFYRHTLASCGADVYLGWNTVFSMAEASVAEKAYIGRSCFIGFAEIGEEAMLADGVHVLSGGREHDHGDSRTSIHNQGQTLAKVRIGKGAWIGAGAVIMADVGAHAIVGAGSVVNRPIPPGVVAAGVPATPRKVRPGFEQNEASQLESNN